MITKSITKPFSGNERNRLIALALFSIAMGMLEAAVVIYLRKLFYSSGFDFPVNPIEDPIIAVTEILREAATLIMLLGIGYLYGRNFITRFAGFLFSFAIWDIFYYVFLKVLLDWPESLFTWDVLFLIPVTWVGPVLAPVLVSLTMILYAFVFIKADAISERPNLKPLQWSIILVSSSIILLSFTLEPTAYILSQNTTSDIFNVSSDQLFAAMQSYVPQKFNWWIFAIGEIGLLLGIGIYWKQLRIGNDYSIVPKY